MRAQRIRWGWSFSIPEHQLFEVDVMTDVCLALGIRALIPKSARSGRWRRFGW